MEENTSRSMHTPLQILLSLLLKWPRLNVKLENLKYSMQNPFSFNFVWMSLWYLKPTEMYRFFCYFNVKNHSMSLKKVVFYLVWAISLLYFLFISFVIYIKLLRIPLFFFGDSLCVINYLLIHKTASLLYHLNIILKYRTWFPCLLECNSINVKICELF